MSNNAIIEWNGPRNGISLPVDKVASVSRVFACVMWAAYRQMVQRCEKNSCGEHGYLQVFSNNLQLNHHLLVEVGGLLVYSPIFSNDDFFPHCHIAK